jgi:IclR family transcriptional regulator, pca regulon regulatory protein
VRVTESGSSEGHPRYFVQALAKGLAMLEAFSEERPFMGVGELARALGWNKPSALRMAQTLVDIGYLDRQADLRYRLSPKVLDLGHTFLKVLSLPAVAEPFLQDAVRRTGESISLAILDGADALYVSRIATTPRIWYAHVSVGSRLPAHATSLGKALLADADAATLLKVLGPPPWAAITEKTITGMDAMLADLARVRETSVAVSDEELELGMRSIGTPIRDNTGNIIAACAIATNTARTSSEKAMGEIADALVDTGRRLSAALGFRPKQRTR